MLLTSRDSRRMLAGGLAALLTCSGPGLLPVAALAEGADVSQAAAPAAGAGSLLEPQASRLRYRFPSVADASRDLECTVGWDDSAFLRPSTQGTELLQQSFALAVSAGNSNTQSYAHAADNVCAYLAAAGFRDMTVNDAFLARPTGDSVGVALAYKDVAGAQGEVARVYAVAVRGLGYGKEWESNMRAGAAGEHEGFSQAAAEVNAQLKAYVAAHMPPQGSQAKLWYAGYSRGGATANLAAAHVTAAAESFFPGAPLAQDDIFAYTFEAPECTDDPEAGSDAYANIVNVVNPDDWVAQLYGAFFGMVRYGRVLAPSGAPTASASWTQDQLTGRAPFEADLARLAPALAYDALGFQLYNSPVTPGVNEGYTGTQGAYVHTVVAWVKEKLGIASRAQYAQEFQDYFMHVAGWFGGTPRDKRAQLFEIFERAVMQDEYVAKCALKGSTLAEVFSSNSSFELGRAFAPLLARPQEGKPDKMVEFTRRVLTRMLGELGESVGPDELERTCAGLVNLTRGALYDLLNSPSVVMTLARNPSILLAHFPEVEHAWLVALAPDDGADDVPDEPEVADGWQLVDGRWLYGAGGAYALGWLSWQGSWYWLGDDGAMRTGWAQVDGSWYWLGASGALHSGWLQQDGVWYYLNASHAGGFGAMLTGWQRVGGAWYYFAPSGRMATGWLHDGTAWYYLEPSGRMLSDARTPDGSYVDASGRWVPGA